MSALEASAGLSAGWIPVGGGGVSPSNADVGPVPSSALERQDKLTGLPDRAVFVEKAEAALRQQPGAVAVLVMGIDRFRELNDTLGHRAGDHVLREIASRVASRRSGSGCVARLEGDELAILCVCAHDASAVLEVANDVRARLEAPVAIEGVALNVEASVGIATSANDGADADELLRRAEVALAHAKAHGGGVEHYSHQCDPFELRRLGLLVDARRALTRGGFLLHYQPKIDLATKRVTGVEALLRWEHPDRGLLPPLEFVPLIERTALIDPVTRFVIDEALGQVASWRSLGLRLEVAVNLAARNLLDPALPQTVEGLLRRHGVPPNQLVLEVTESGVMADAERATLVLAELRSRGVGVSIDDFGTGNASLAYLAGLPATELKIDRSFVAAAYEDPRADAIVRASTDLARNFGLAVVAEGIESDAAMEHVIRIGCAVGQGYRISRPLPAQDITTRLQGLGEPAVSGREMS